jgi:hypothetical protein
MTEKVCTICGVKKPLDDFSWHMKKDRKKGYHKNQCKPCLSAAHSARRAKDPSFYRKFEWPSKLRTKYGITVADYDRMLEEQDGGCAICGTRVPCVRRHKNIETEKFFVDHCHVTGKVRGLLCNACNRALGYLRDDPTIIDRAASYLRRQK